MNTTISRTDAQPGFARGRAAQGFTGGLARAASGILETLLTWQRRADERRHLASLDDRLLKDMGLERADVVREASKPFWRV